MKTVEDREVNEALQHALKYCPSLLIEQYEVRSKSWLSKAVRKTFFNVYHEHPGYDGKPYQARYQSSASGHKSIVLAYLYGIINGILKQQLAERDYPITTFQNMWEEAVVKRERTAFIKGLDIVIKFHKWQHPLVDIEKIESDFKVFLTEKYGSNEQNG